MIETVAQLLNSKQNKQIRIIGTLLRINPPFNKEAVLQHYLGENNRKIKSVNNELLV